MTVLNPQICEHVFQMRVKFAASRIHHQHKRLMRLQANGDTAHFLFLSYKPDCPPQKTLLSVKLETMATDISLSANYEDGSLILSEAYQILPCDNEQLVIASAIDAFFEALAKKLCET